jgi:hypothetical protein
LIVESLAKRPWAVSKYAAVPLAMRMLTQEMNDMTDKDWLDLKKSLPFYIKDHKTYMVVPSKTKNGNFQWMNFNYFVPWGNYLSLFENMSNRDVGETVKSLGITNPFLQLPYTFSVARKDRSPVNPYTGQELYNMLDTPADKAAKTVYALATTFIPPMLTKEGALGYTYKAAVGKDDKWGREVTPAQAIGRWFGFNLLETTPKQTYVIKKGMINDVRSNLYRVLTDPSMNDKEKEEYKDRARSKISELVNE